jgi:hypothetical protein
LREAIGNGLEGFCALIAFRDEVRESVSELELGLACREGTYVGSELDGSRRALFSGKGTEFPKLFIDGRLRCLAMEHRCEKKEGYCKKSAMDEGHGVSLNYQIEVIPASARLYSPEG